MGLFWGAGDLMKGFYPIDDYSFDNAVLGYRQTQKSKVWYLRYYRKTGPQRGNIPISLKLTYEPSKASLTKARKLAAKAHREQKASEKAGLSPSVKLSPNYMREQYLKDIRAKAVKNEKLIEKKKAPIWRVEGGRNYWNYKRLAEAERFLDKKSVRDKKTGEYKFEDGAVKRFFVEELPKDLKQVDHEDLNAFRDWALREFEWAPGTINKAIAQIRQVWKFAVQKRWVKFVPQINQQPQDLAGRTRRALQPEEYQLIRDRARQRYMSLVERGTTSGYPFDLYYQFSLWLLIMTNCGIRPPGGNEDKQLIRWDDVKVVERKGREERFLLRRGDKDHLDYEAFILPNAHDYLDALKRYQLEQGVDSEYMFAHTTEKEGGWRKGDPIKSFKKQWANVVKDCGLDVPVGSPQKNRLTPYSCRGFFITRRLEASDKIRVEDLALALGTSSEIIREIYYDFSTRRKYSSLISGGNKREKLRPVYENGIYIGRE